MGRGDYGNHHAIHARSLEGDFSGWKKLAEELVAGGTKSGLVSFEGFYHLDEKQLKRVAAELSGVRVQVILYLRRQSDMVRSGVAQRIKEGAQHLPLGGYGPKDLNGMAQDYRPVIDRFVRVFGRKALKLRRYERGRWPENNLILDFLQALDIHISGDVLRKSFVLPPVDPNPTLGVEAVHFLDTLEQLGIAVDMRQKVVRLLMNQQEDDRSTIVSDEVALQIDQAFDESNRVIARKWFGEDELFSEPSRFVHRPPREARLARYFTLLRRWLPRWELACWDGARADVRELQQAGRLELDNGWSRTGPRARLLRARGTLVFRAELTGNADMAVKFIGRWVGQPGMLNIRLNGQLLYRHPKPTGALHASRTLLERAGPCVEMDFAVEEGLEGKESIFVLEALVYRRSKPPGPASKHAGDAA